MISCLSLALAWVPKSNGARILVATWCFVCLVFVSSYGGILTALLTAPKIKITVDSLHDLVYKDEVPFFFEQGTAPYDYFRVSSCIIFIFLLK